MLAHDTQCVQSLCTGRYDAMYVQRYRQTTGKCDAGNFFLHFYLQWQRKTVQRIVPVNNLIPKNAHELFHKDRRKPAYQDVFCHTNVVLTDSISLETAVL